MQKRKIDELISHFNRKVADMDIDREYKMELLGMITAIGIACEKELLIVPERKTGKWIRGDAEKLTGSQRCSICHKACYKGKDYFNYCPNCGADMRGEGHE